VGRFQVRAGGQGLDFYPPDRRVMTDRSLGAQLVLPPEATGSIAHARVYALVEASASYPVAFAPRVLKYEDPDCVVHTPVPPGCSDLHHESFLDGGVFDNYPVSLAVGMERALRAPEAPAARSHVIYVDPSVARGPLRDVYEEQQAPQRETVATGIDALVHFGTSFVPSARSYELQGFIRGQFDDPNRAFIQSSSRAHPLIGEHLDAFAAFLGRPFREFDFYAGVADGFHFIASQILCDPTRLRDAEPLHDRDDCTRAETMAMATDGFGLDTVGRVVAGRVVAREYPEYAWNAIPLDSTHAGPRPSDAERARVLLAIEDATYATMRDRRPYDCPSGDVVATILCFDGFDRILAPLSSDKAFMQAIERWADDKSCHPDDLTTYDPTNCLAEPALYRLLDNPHAAMQHNLDRMLHQMRNAEAYAKDHGRPDYKFLVKTAELLLRSTDQQSRRGLQGDPSSIAPGDAFPWWLAHFLPYYVGGYVGATGLDVGWQPGANFGACYYWFGRKLENCHMYLAVPVEYDHVRRDYDPLAPYSNFTSVSPMVGHNFAKLWLNQIGVGVRQEINARAPLVLSRRSPPMPEVSALLMVGKARVSVFRLDPSLVPGHHPRPVATLSVADANGLLYWLVR
jgi:hypothetical protein